MALGGEIERLYILFDADGRPYVKGLRALEMATHTSGGRMVSAWSKYGGASGKAVAAGLAVGTVALAAFGALVVKTGVKFEELEHTIRKGTGATGKALEGLTDSAKKVYAVVEQSSADVATVVADLNTRLGATGEHLEKLAKQMIDLSDVSGEVPAALVAATTRAFGDWSIATEKQSEALDWMWKVSQSTGIGVTQLSQKVVQAGAPLRELGFDFETATTMMGQFEREGVNAEAILGSLKIGLARMASEGFTNAEDALAELMRRIKEAPEGLDAVSMAMEIFGSRAAADFTLAVREERFEFDELLNSLRSSPETIAAAESATETLGDKWKTTLHKMELQLEPLGTRVLEYLNSAFDQMSETAEKEGWGVAVGQIVGDAIGEAAKFAMAEAGPFLIEVGWRFASGAVEGTARGTLQMLGLDPYGDYSTDLERWENYIREQMREYTAYGSVEGFRLAMGDLNNAIQTEGLLEGLYLGRPKTADEMMELARRLGVVLSDDELRRAIEAGWNQTAYEQYMEELVWGPQRRANERGVRGQVLPDLLTPGAFGVGGMDWGQFASEAGGAMDKAAEDAEDLVEKTKEAAEAAKYWADNEELLVEYTQTLAGLHDTMTSPKTIWQEAEGSLSDYLAKMDEVIAAWDKFETNLIQLAEQYGPEFGADVIMAAAEQGPEYVAALVGSDPEVVRRALGQLQKLLTKDMDGLALAVAEASGTAGGTTAQSYVEAWTDHFKAQAAYLEQSVKETLPTDGSTEGALLGTSYANAFLTRMQNTLSGLGLFGGTAGVFPGPTVGTRLPGTHDVGGPLPHGTVAINMSGATEYVVTEDLPREIQNLIGELRSDLGPDGDLVRSIMSAFGERSSIAGSYISRERSRYGMLEAEGAPLERLEEVLLDQIRFISEAVAEAEAQLAAAKAEGLPAEEINDLAENLYDLREDAAKARKELDELADDGIDPLAQAADEASGRLDMLDSLFGMLSQSSSHMAQALGLIPEMLGAAQTELNSYIDLMNAATDATDRFDYGQRAIGSIETMFGIERQAIDTAMREELDTLEEWRDRTQAELSRRADSLARAGETMSAAMQTSRERLRAEQQKDMAELTAHYDEQLALMDEQDRELERRKVASELQSLYNAQALSASDLDRIQNLREQQRQQDRADARKTLQDQRDAAIKALQEQQEIEQQKLESQLETQEKTLEAQQRALDEAQRKADAYYDDQRRLIEDNAQQQIDLAVEKYAKEIEIIMAMATDVTGAITEMTGAVMDSALAKVDTTLSGGGSGVGAGGGWPADIGAVPTGQMTVAEYQALIAGVDNYAQKAALQNLYYGQAHLYDQLGVYKTGSHPGSDYEWDPHLGMEGGWKKVNEASHQATIDQAWESFYGNAKQYDDGGWLMPGVTLAVNKTGLPERVVPGGSHDSLDINLHISTDGPITDAQVGRIAGVLEELGREQYAARYNY